MDPIEGMKIASAAPVETLRQTDGPVPSEGRSFGEVLAEKTGANPQGPEPIEAAGIEPTPPTSSVELRERLDTFVADVLGDEKRLDGIMNRAARGENLDHEELLQLQALMYGYAQKIDLATKVVEKSTGAVKQLMQTQV